MDAILDHLVVVAPSLEAGAAYVLQRTGLTMAPGGQHREMGTHNLLLGLGDIFLEVIAIDPLAAPPAQKRWFNMSDEASLARDWAQGRRLRGIVARNRDLDGFLRRHGEDYGRPVRVTRGDRQWDFALRRDGEWPLSGALPCMLDWGARGTPAQSMPQSGAHLAKLVLETPEPIKVAALYRVFAPKIALEITQGPTPRWRAELSTPKGVRVLE